MLFKITEQIEKETILMPSEDELDSEMDECTHLSASLFTSSRLVSPPRTSTTSSCTMEINGLTVSPPLTTAPLNAPPLNVSSDDVIEIKGL